MKRRRFEQPPLYVEAQRAFSSDLATGGAVTGQKFYAIVMHFKNILAMSVSVRIVVLPPKGGTPIGSLTRVMSSKSTVDEIRARFDADVERFSNLETGQSATIDAALAMSLVAEAAAVTTPKARSVLDVGCGAGNYTLKLLQHLPDLDCTLVDLSRPMLERAKERVGPVTRGQVTCLAGDIRGLDLGSGQFDVILAAAVLHHLRTDNEWRSVFAEFFAAMRPGGSIWIFDLVESSSTAVETIMQRRYGEYLTAFKGEAYRDHVFAYVAQEDTPRPLIFQLELLREVGFREVEILHKNGPFAAFGAMK
jgi:tRNA (cmo5U34)-methyltransferase